MYADYIARQASRYNMSADFSIRHVTKTDDVLRHPSLGVNLTGIVVQDGMVCGYRGIPYGTIRERWTRATPYTHEPGSELDTRSFGQKCPQPAELNCTKDFGPFIPFPDVPEDDLNCLNLNVYYPNQRGAKPLPVFVWIHGGSLCVGAGSDPIWDPAKLVAESIRLDRPIVAVSINYRLGPFGFLAPRDPDDITVEQGNFGFHDQYLALQWVQAHIAGFDGDPSRVTIGGESAGGCSVHAQIALQATCKTDKMFDRAILQSGTLAVMGFCDGASMDLLWRRALSDAGIDPEAEALEAMRAMPARQIMSLPALKLDGYSVLLDDIFLTRPLVTEKGRFANHPHHLSAILHGDNAHEGNFFRLPAHHRDALTQLQHLATEMLGESGCTSLFDLYQLSDCVDKDELAWRLHQFPEDVRFYLHSNELQRAWPDSAFYHLSSPSPFSSSAWPGESFHTLDLLYVFGNFDHFLTADDMTPHLRVGQEMRRVWLDFMWGQDPWEQSSEGTSMVFGIDGMRPERFDRCRGWSEARRQRLEALRELGVARITQLCTVLYP